MSKHPSSAFYFDVYSSILNVLIILSLLLLITTYIVSGKGAGPQGREGHAIGLIRL